MDEGLERIVSHGQDPIYLDYNATTPILPEVVDAMLPYLRAHFGNPSSSHVYGVRARKAVDRAREQVAALLDCDPGEIIFTSGGTESSNLAIHGVLDAVSSSDPNRRGIVTSVIEHPATEKPCAWLERSGHPVARVGVDEFGRMRVADAETLIDETTALLTVMHSNNETGVIQPVAELARLARAAGALVHTDAAQSVGKVPVSVGDLDVDLLTVAGHKLYAPKGIGALYVRKGTSLEPFLRGGGQEGGLRPGTENVASIVGLGAACAVALRDLDRSAARMQQLRDALWRRLADAIPGLALNGHPELRLPNTLNVRIPGAAGDAVLVGAPEIAASTGSACHAGNTSASAVIRAMGVDPDQALGTVRLTVGRSTTEDDISRAAEALVRAWKLITE
ncbi:MAG: cysteine desulfurase family protein [Wenzhouxiangellaceae bacterium]